jgi:hypothetical protein
MLTLERDAEQMKDRNSDETPGRKMGRPSLPDDVARTERVVTLLTKQEKQVLLEHSELNSMSISTYSHKLILEGLAKNSHQK